MTAYIRARTVTSGRRFDVKYRLAGRYSQVQHAGTFLTRKEATIRLQLVRGWLAGGRNPRLELARVLEDGRSFSDLHEEWLQSRRRVTDGTLQGYRHREKVLLDAFGRRPIEAITLRDVISWVGKLEGTYKPGTVRLFVSQLRMVFDFAGIPNVARDRRIELPPVSKQEIAPPNADATLAALRALPDRLIASAVVMEQCGSRVTETVSLTQDDLDSDGGRIRFPRERTKGQRSGRWVPCPDWLLAGLMERLPTGVNRHAMGRAMHEITDGEISPHDLRHRRASLWHLQGVPPAEAASWLGHTTNVYLSTYAHVMPVGEIEGQDLASLLR